MLKTDVEKLFLKNTLNTFGCQNIRLKVEQEQYSLHNLFTPKIGLTLYMINKTLEMEINSWLFFGMENMPLLSYFNKFDLDCTDYTQIQKI